MICKGGGWGARAWVFESSIAQDTVMLLEMDTTYGFPSMLGSINCMHWKWKNCPAAWHGQFKGHNKNAISFLSLWPVRRHRFGMHTLECPGLAMTSVCPVVSFSCVGKLANEKSPPMEFQENGCTYNKEYYLMDGIYPKWSTSMKPIFKSLRWEITLLSKYSSGH